MTTDFPPNLIAAKIRESRRIAVTSHLRPDGDSICTSLALALMGEALGKTVDIVNTDRTPFPFRDLPDAARIRTGPIDPSLYDAIIFLECADVSRSGHTGLDDGFKINIDHHYSNFFYGAINWVEPEAPAVGEMVFRLAGHLGVTLSPQAAEHLYCAIVSDTGSFQFSNTTTCAFEACAGLTELGASPIRVSEFLFNNTIPEKVILLGRVLSRLRLNSRGNIATISMFRSDLESLNLKEIDVEDITTVARSIRNLEMVMFFKEIAPKTFRVSLRSKGGANAALAAEHFGGGGHVHASGFTAHGAHDELIRTIPDAIEKLLDEARSGTRPAT